MFELVDPGKPKSREQILDAQPVLEYRQRVRRVTFAGPLADEEREGGE